KAAKGLIGDLEVKTFRFDVGVREPEVDEAETPKPEGRETQLGDAMVEVEKQVSQSNRRLARLVVLSDFASNSGTNPGVAARRLRDQQAPVTTVVFGAQTAGAESRDVAIREITAGPTVF